MIELYLLVFVYVNQLDTYLYSYTRDERYTDMERSTKRVQVATNANSNSVIPKRYQNDTNLDTNLDDKERHPQTIALQSHNLIISQSHNRFKCRNSFALDFILVFLVHGCLNESLLFALSFSLFALCLLLSFFVSFFLLLLFHLPFLLLFCSVGVQVYQLVSNCLNHCL